MSKITDTIKKVQAATEAVLGREVNTDEVLQTIEAIEVLVGAKKQAEQPQPIPTTYVVTKGLPQPAVVEPVVEQPVVKKAAKSRNRSYTNPVRIIDWEQHQEFLDLVLNGQVHVLSNDRLADVMTNTTQFATKLRKEAKLRGYKMVNIWNDKKKRTVRIHAVK